MKAKSKTIRVVTCHLSHVASVAWIQNDTSVPLQLDPGTVNTKSRVYDYLQLVSMSSQRWVFTVGALSGITANGVTSNPVPDVVGWRWICLLTKQWDLTRFTDIHEFWTRSHGSPLLVARRKTHYFSASIGSPRQSDDDIWFKGTHDLMPVQRLWYLDLVLRQQRFGGLPCCDEGQACSDDAIKGNKLIAWSVTIMTRSTSRHFCRYSNWITFKSNVFGVSSACMLFLRLEELDIQEVDGTNVVPQQSCVRKNHIQVSMMARRHCKRPRYHRKSRRVADDEWL